MDQDSSLKTVEKKSTDNIKQKLNQHLKRKRMKTAASGDTSTADDDKDSKPLQLTTPKKTKKPKTKDTAPKCKAEAAASATEADTSPQVHEKPEKSQKPDILTMILNEKRKSLLNDPQVQECLKSLIAIKRRL